VRVRNTHHFAYANGTRHISIGTTCYGWVHQREDIQQQTLATLKDSPFNKVRMMVLPTRRNEREPVMVPFETTADNQIDFTRFNTRFFKLLDQRIADLRDINVQADIILFHPYGRADFPWARMEPEVDDRYLRYVVARLSAFRNVWWSMANEYDLLRAKRESDWDRFFQIVQSEDPANHLRSIHQISRPYDQNKPWVTHVSAQNGEAVADFGRAVIYRQLTRKPVVFDEVRYEGDIDVRWGNMSGEQMTSRFWYGTIGGTYVGHGETFTSAPGVTWLGQGGKLVGQSWRRIAFLKQVLEDGPESGIDPIDQYYDSRTAGRAGQYYLIYFGTDQPTEWAVDLYRAGLSEGAQFTVDVLDTWNMTITPMDKPITLRRHNNYRYRAEGDVKVPLPGKPYMAIRMKRVPGTGTPSTRAATRRTGPD
jgi:hypothetical protein